MPLDYLIKLYDLKPAEPGIQKLEQDGISIRRALAPEKHIITEWVKSHFSRGWASECEISFSNRPISCFIATRDGAIVGFECYDATFKGFLGPGGVSKDYRNRGIGTTLRLRSLHSMMEQGYAYAIVGAGVPNFAEAKLGAIPIQGSSPGAYKGMLKL